MTFQQYKREVTRLARQRGAGHLVPGDNDLFVCWERRQPPVQVAALHCTPGASRLRHGVDKAGGVAAR